MLGDMGCLLFRAHRCRCVKNAKRKPVLATPSMQDASVSDWMTGALPIQHAWSGEFPYLLFVRQRGDPRSLSVGRSAAQEASATNQKCPDEPGQCHVRCLSISARTKSSQRRWVLTGSVAVQPAGEKP